jgi:hypothetical protein
MILSITGKDLKIAPLQPCLLLCPIPPMMAAVSKNMNTPPAITAVR